LLSIKSKSFVGALVATFALGIGASAASAAPATWAIPAGGTVGVVGQAPGGITMTWGPGAWNTRTCVPGNIVGLGQNVSGQGSVSPFVFLNNMVCHDGNGNGFNMRIEATAPLLANKNAGAFSLDTTGYFKVDDTSTASWAPVRSATTPASFSVPFTNGTTPLSGANPSSFTFNNTLVGYVTFFGVYNVPQPLRLTGTIKVQGPASGALTLQ
jgi:hypothetical protein